MPSTPAAASRFSEKNAQRSSPASTWWRSAVHRSFRSSLAAVRTRSCPGDTLAGLGVRRVLVCPAFSSAPPLRSTRSGSGRPSPFAGFPATMKGSDFSSPYITGFGSSPSRCGPGFIGPGRRRDLPVPAQGAYTHAGVCAAKRSRVRACPCCLPLNAQCRRPEGVVFAAQYPAYAHPCQHFANPLADISACLGDSVVR
jgi:hypothetical protein